MAIAFLRAGPLPVRQGEVLRAPGKMPPFCTDALEAMGYHCLAEQVAMAEDGLGQLRVIRMGFRSEEIVRRTHVDLLAGLIREGEVDRYTAVVHGALPGRGHIIR